MKKNDVFTFTAPNGEEVTAVILDKQLKRDDCILTIYWYLCYAQNRLFYYIEKYFPDVDKTEYETGATIADYAILPDYDDMLQLHTSMEYPQWEQNLEAEIQGMNDR